MRGSELVSRQSHKLESRERNRRPQPISWVPYTARLGKRRRGKPLSGYYAERRTLSSERVLSFTPTIRFLGARRVGSKVESTKGRYTPNLLLRHGANPPGTILENYE